MEYTTLGRTGLKVSVAGLGCGGFSRLGLGTGKSEAEAVGLVHEAFSLGVNLFDTAAVYGTEAVLGKALKGLPRDQVVITTKAWTPRGAGPFRRRSGCREPRQFAQRARHRLHRRLPAARRRARGLRPCARGDCPGLARRADQGKNPLSRRHRNRLRRCRARDGAARGRGRGVGRGHDRVSHDAPERPPIGVSAHGSQSASGH